MTEEPVGDHYRRSRERVSALLGAMPVDVASQPVEACPGWDVHDVVAHLVCIVDDALAGRLAGPPTTDATAEQVARLRDIPLAAMLDRWNEQAPAFEEVVSQASVWPAAIDVLSHEHDLRHAVGRPGAHDDPSVSAVAALLIDALAGPPIDFDLGSSRRTSGGSGAPAERAVRTTAFEVLRFRLGRRSAEQVLALDWSPGPPASLEAMFVFGPRDVPLLEDVNDVAPPP